MQFLIINPRVFAQINLLCEFWKTIYLSPCSFKKRNARNTANNKENRIESGVTGVHYSTGYIAICKLTVKIFSISLC